jgi:hypothetical protein
MWSTAAERTLQESDLAAAERVELERTFDRLLAENGPALARLAASYTNTPPIATTWCRRSRSHLARPAAIPRRMFGADIHLPHRSQSRGDACDAAASAGGREEIDVPDSALNPEAGFAREQQGERLRSAVHALPLLYRQVVTLMLEGMDYGEIAAGAGAIGK